VDTGRGGNDDDYEKTRQSVLKKVKRFEMDESKIRSLIRDIISEVTVGIPGYGMTGKEFEDRVHVPAVYDGRTGKVKPDEANFVAQKLKQMNPERVVAYSRGAPVYNNAVMDPEMAGMDPAVTFMAPSSYRKWSNAPVRRAAPGSITIIGDKDKVVPYKQACRNAVEADTPMYVLPGFSHTGILHSRAQVTPDSFEVDANACLSDPLMPDWGPSVNASDEEMAAQKERVKVHIKHEALVRNLVRSILAESSVPSNFASSATHSAGWISPDGEYFFDANRRDHGEWAVYHVEKDPKLMATFLQELKKETDPLPPPPPRTPAEQAAYDAKSEMGKKMDDWRRQGGRKLEGKPIPPYKNMEELYFSDISSEVRSAALRTLLMHNWSKVINAYGLEVGEYPQRIAIDKWMDLGSSAGSNPDNMHIIFSKNKRFVEGDWFDIDQFAKRFGR
jgi:hypothetical protein